jgi:hypothetical protein
MNGEGATAQAGRLLEQLGAALWGGPPPDSAREPGGFAAIVDGVRILVRAEGPAVRLRAALGRLPEEEGQARSLLAAFLPHADAGPELLCAEADGTVLLVATLRPEEAREAEESFARFADAAVHWTARLARLGRAAPARPLAPGPTMIFP